MGRGEEELPVELLKQVESALPAGEIDLKLVYHALGFSAGGSPVQAGDIEFRVRGRHAPEPEGVSVRRVLSERLEAATKARQAADEALRVGRAEKLEARERLTPGTPLPRTRNLKLAAKAADAVEKLLIELQGALPPMDTVSDLRELQLEWLPEKVREARKEVGEKLSVVTAALAEVTPAVEARAVGKKHMREAAGRMGALRQAVLPQVTPELEDAGTHVRHSIDGAFYISNQLLAGRRCLAAALAKHAAELAASTAKHMTTIERASEMASDRYALSPRGNASPRAPLALDSGVTLMRSKALMLLTHDESTATERITPEAVVEMAERLGIVLCKAFATEDAEAEYCLLWIAVEALRAPLPPLWRKLPSGSFEHSVTKETTEEHPLLPVYEDMVQHERRRKPTARPYANLENFMYFATDGDDEGAFFFYNFATRQSSTGRKLPAEAVAEQMARRRKPPSPKKNVARATAASTGARVEKAGGGSAADGSGGGHLSGSGGGPHGSRERRSSQQERSSEEEKGPKPMTKQLVAKLRAQAVGVRKCSLALRPRALPELLVAARMLQVDLVAQPQLIWLVDLVLASEFMPAGWEPVPREQMTPLPSEHNRDEMQMMGHVQDVEWLPPIERLWHVATTGRAPPQFHNQLCSLVTERHPCDSFVRSVLGPTKQPKFFAI